MIRPATTEPLLRVRSLHVGYGRAVALLGVDLDVPAGGTVAVLGANGAGKTTLLRSVTGLLRYRGGRITGGTVELAGERIDRLPADAVVRRGVAQVLEGRRTFARLTVEENLVAGAFTRPRSQARAAVAEVLATFPELAARRQEPAGALSGGQQQLLAMARAMVQAPRLLLLDEPTLGLSPTAADQVASVVRDLHAAGTAILIVEQRAAMALSVAQEGVVLDGGRVTARGPAGELLDHPALRDAYLGAGAG